MLAVLVFHRDGLPSGISAKPGRQRVVLLALAGSYVAAVLSLRAPAVPARNAGEGSLSTTISSTRADCFTIFAVPLCET